MQPSPRIYRITTHRADSCLRQGEILSDLIQFRLDVATLGAEAPTASPYRHPFALLLTQDCDLEQDFFARSGTIALDKQLPNLLFCEVARAQELYDRIRQTNRKLWDRIKINKDERYHYLQKVEPSCDTLFEGLPELGVDFKKYFTVPTDEVYRRVEIGEAKRRSLIVSPYLEHLSSRFAYFLSRVALPQDHLSE